MFVSHLKIIMGKILEERSEHYGEANKQFVIDLVNKGENVTPATRKMCKEFGLEYHETVGRSYRRFMQDAKVTDNLPNNEVDHVFQTAKSKQFDSKKKRFLISWAQQETPIHEEFLSNMEAYANHIDAEILIIAGRYRSPISLESSKQQEKKDKDKSNWHPRTVPYLIASRQNIHEHLTVLADVKVQPTASVPLSGFNSITGLESCIIGHPRVHLKSLPVLDSYPNKLLWTTGAVTVENYSDTKAGKKGSFHHTLGMLVVELDEDIFHVRQVQCEDDGSFYDLTNYVANGVASEYIYGCPAIIFGDLHLGNEHQENLKQSLQMAQDFDCDKIILHDVMENYAISHHELKNPVVLAQRELDGTWNLESEIDYMVKWFQKNSQFKFVSVMSNHTAFIDRWILNNDWRKSPNKAKYLQLANIVVSGEAPKGLVPYILDKETENVTSLSYNDSYRICGWELGLHGDMGNAGSRGSVTQFKNLNTKTITGHSHSPSREDGALVVGTLTKMRLGYNIGLSSWLASNVLIYPNGKASHIHIINNKYTTLLD